MTTNLLAAGAGWLADTLAGSAGVAVTYTRPPATAGVPLTAVVASSSPPIGPVGQTAIRAATTDRDYLILLADLAAAGLFPPAAGDRLAEVAGGTAAGFVAAKRADGPVWEWGEPERVTVRVRTTPAKET